MSRWFLGKEIEMSHLFRAAFGIAACALVALVLHADDKPAGAIELFNGKDLTGWGYKTGEKFDGKTESDDKRFSAKDGVIIVHPGTGIRQLWTTAQFPKDFELKLEFRAAVNADSGLFIRA